MCQATNINHYGGVYTVQKLCIPHALGGVQPKVERLLQVDGDTVWLSDPCEEHSVLEHFQPEQVFALVPEQCPEREIKGCWPHNEAHTPAQKACFVPEVSINAGIIIINVTRYMEENLAETIDRSMDRDCRYLIRHTDQVSSGCS